MVEDGKAYRYAKWCLDETERKVPRYVKLQAQQWIDIADGNNQEAYVDEGQYEKICKLLRLLVHPDLKCSIYDGLEDNAWLLITATLCTICRPETARYTLSGADPDLVKIRYYATALLEVSRKNHKTFNSAVIFILLMLMEPNFSRFFSVAPDLELSSELQNAIRKIIKSSPIIYDDEDPAFKLLRKQVKCLLNDNEYTPLAYSRDGMDGKLAQAWLADEAGALDDYPVEAMRSSQIEILSKLGIIISTQYPNDNNVFLTEIDIAKKTLDGLLEDTRYFALLYEPDDDLRSGETWMTDDRCIYQSNPVAVEKPLVFDNLVKKRTMAVMYESKRENYLCKHNNIRYKGLGTEGYIDIQKVKLCSAEVPDDFWSGKRVWIGLDLSMTDDNTSMAMVTEYENMVYAKVFGFIPEAAVDRKSMREKVDYKDLIKRGECFACGDEVIDYGFVERFIIGLPEKYGVEIVQVGYDRYNAISTVQKLEENGIECVEIKQHSSVLHAPTKLLKEYILQMAFRYCGNRMLEINFQNARCTKDTNNNMYVNKKRSEGKVDMVVSTINAMYLLQQEQLYGDGGFIVQFA